MPTTPEGSVQPVHTPTPESELAKIINNFASAILVNNTEDDDKTRDAKFDELLAYAYKRLAAWHQKEVAEARTDAVTQIMSAKTEGLFDDGDLFIKREPIEQVCINLLGYEKFKAIKESLPVAHPTKEPKS